MDSEREPASQRVTPAQCVQGEAAGGAGAAGRFRRARGFGEVRREVRVQRETLVIVGGLVCHTRELGCGPTGSGEPRQDRGVRWIEGGEELGCSFLSPMNLSLQVDSLALRM